MDLLPFSQYYTKWNFSLFSCEFKLRILLTDFKIFNTSSGDLNVTNTEDIMLRSNWLFRLPHLYEGMRRHPKINEGAPRLLSCIISRAKGRLVSPLKTHKGTRMVKDGEDQHGYKRRTWKI